VAFPNPHLVLLVFWWAGFSGEEKGGGGTVGGELGSGPVLCHVGVNSHIYGMYIHCKYKSFMLTRPDFLHLHLSCCNVYV